MPKNRISDAKLTEVSLIFKTGPDGQEWAPRNQDALVLGTKGGPADKPAENKIGAFLDRIMKGFAKKGWIVNDGVPDNIDGDGDGAEDYEQILGIVMDTYYDLQQATWIGDSQARSVAVCTVIDNMLERLDDVRKGGYGERKGGALETEKAGAKLSKSTKDKLEEMVAHADAIKALRDELVASGEQQADKEASEGGDGEGEDDVENKGKKGAPVQGENPTAGATAGGAQSAAPASETLTIEGGQTLKAADIDALVNERVDRVLAQKSLGEWVPGEVGEDGLPVNIAELDELVVKAKAKSKKSEEPYGSDDDAGYADPGYREDKKKRYPLKKDGKLDEERVRAAWSYIHQEKNAAEYSDADLAKVKKRIASAAKELGIEIEDKGGPAAAIDVAAIAQSVADMLKGSVTEPLAKITERLDALETVAKAAPAQGSPVSETVAAIKAARETATAPGGLGSLDAETLQHKANPIIETGDHVVEIDRQTSTVQDVIKARNRHLVSV